MTTIDLATVVGKVLDIFSERDVENVLATLDAYGNEPHEKERFRGWLAILKLCDQKDTDQLIPYINAAKQDYRDVLARAESPNQLQHGPTTDKRKAKALAQMDKRQHRRWLSRVK